MNRKDPARVLDDISNERIPQDLNLLPGILEKTMTTKTATRPRLRLTALLLVLALLIALLSLPGTASALQKLVGYIPGIGPVEQSAPLRVLASTVSASRDGFTITVESALLDAERTILQYRIAGPIPRWADPTLEPKMCQEYPILRLPNGKALTYPAREGGHLEGETQWKDVYGAVPAGENQAVLVLPCLTELPAGDGPQNWEIPLAFAPAPPDMTVYPVVEQPTAQPTQPEASDGEAWMQITLDGFATLQDGYYLQTNLRWQNDPAIHQVEIFPDSLRLFDAAGQAVPVSMADSMAPFTPAENQTMPLNLQTGPILTPGPAKLVVDYVGVSMSANTSFTIDVGSSPQPGQKWEVDKDLDINGYALRVLSAEYIQPQAGEPAWLMLYLSSDSGILTVIAGDTEHEIMGTGGSPNSADVHFRAGWRYKDAFPQGVITVEISTITVRRSGPWTLTWTPPLAAATPTVQATLRPRGSGLCPNAPTVQVSPQDLPVELTGRVVFTDGMPYEMFLANLDGSERIALGPGLIPDLSPDGKRVVYLGLERGLYVRDVAGGDARLISGTVQEGVYDIYPRWSPDGRQIAFDRAVDHVADIYVVNADDSDLRSVDLRSVELRAVVNGPEDEWLLGWSPDGRSIFYRVTTPEYLSIRMLDLESGQTFAVDELPLGADHGRISPDGSRILYITEQGVYLKMLDGSAPVLLLDDAGGLGNPIWSPDGQWLLMTQVNAADGAITDHVLLQPDTCQFLQLDAALGDMLSAWVR